MVSAKSCIYLGWFQKALLHPIWLQNPRHEAGDGQEERGAEDSKPRDDLIGRLHNSKVWHTNLPRAVAGAKIIKLQSQSALLAPSVDGFYKVVNTDKPTAP